jgi:hypothetical protein
VTGGELAGILIGAALPIDVGRPNVIHFNRVGNEGSATVTVVVE